MSKLVSYENAVKAMRNINSKKIDIIRTIENAFEGDFLGEYVHYCEPVDSSGYIDPFFLDSFDGNDSDLDEDDYYHKKIFEHLEKDGIYIALCYLIDSLTDDESKFNNNSSLKDEYFIFDDGYFEGMEISEYYSEEDPEEWKYFEISNAFNNNIEIKCPEKYDLSCDEASDYGIKIKKTNDSYNVQFGHRQSSMAGPCRGPPQFYKFTTYTKFPEDNLNNPINQLMILLMEKTIIFEE